LQPWTRLHAIRDYYSMAALSVEKPNVRVTFNLTPVLLAQIEDYVERGATDRALDLTLKPAEVLTNEERETVLSSFFDADWHHQIFPHGRYKDLFDRRSRGLTFETQDVRDLQMWFSLAWFGKEFQDGDVKLATGEVVSVKRFIDRGDGFAASDIEAMAAEQIKVLRAVIPIHRRLQDAGRIEVSTTPFYHPILPLLVDTDRATIDRPGARRPGRFTHPEDAEAQVQRAVEAYERWFGRPPRGMWPAEGAVAEFVIPLFARFGIRWIATDQGVLARSGRWGYDTNDPSVLCRAYRAGEESEPIAMFFRDTQLSDAIGFRYQHWDSAERAAESFMAEIEERFASKLRESADAVLAIVLDGENAWGGYPEDGRPFLRALYAALDRSANVRTVTFSEFLDGDDARGVRNHARTTLTRVYELFTGSWIDEAGSEQGVDLGTWIGEGEENDAWALLTQARSALDAAGASPDVHPAAFESLYRAEGSDWLWWYGGDQDSGRDADFDELFRLHIASAYRGAGLEPPSTVGRPLIPRTVIWSFSRRTPRIRAGDRLLFRTNCPGVLDWRIGRGVQESTTLAPAGGVMAGARRFQTTLGPFEAGATLEFGFRCGHEGCRMDSPCCRGGRDRVEVD
ncbi:MAG: hypothetical protein K8I02_13595, partial [Candidatus Methylomirabilis sp.]|nr:hypothetical protein [Deltaproteobacteria bacterium]